MLKAIDFLENTMEYTRARLYYYIIVLVLVVVVS